MTSEAMLHKQGQIAGVIEVRMGQNDAPIVRGSTGNGAQLRSWSV